jgi:hypothetical protein
MLFRVTVEIGFVNGSCSPEQTFNVRADDKEDVKKIVTPDYIRANVSDDWGVPIANITIVRADAISVR